MFKDRKLIKNIRQLRDVEPDKNWVFSVEEDVLGHQPTFAEEVSSFLALITWKPVLVSLTAVLTIIIIGGGFLYPFPVKEDSGAVVQLGIPLENLKEQIVRTTAAIEKQTDHAVVDKTKREILHQSITTSQETVSAIEKIDHQKVLASQTKELKEATSQLKIVFVRNEIATLEKQKEQGLLTSSEIESLTDIQGLYQNEEYEEAFVQLWILGAGINHSD